MKTSEIISFIEKHEIITPYFRGIFPLDLCPDKMTPESFVVINTELRNF